MAPTDSGYKATAAFTVWDDEQSKSVAFDVGDDVPDNVAASVGGHVLNKKPPAKAPAGAAVDGDAFDAAVAAAVEDRLEKASADAVTKALAEARERETAAFTALVDSDDVYDPAADGETADKVKAYLTSLDRDTVAGQWEFNRVTEAEKAGPNRKSAFVE